MTGNCKEKLLGHELPNYKVKDLVFQDINKVLEDCDMFAFSPCLEAGVSIERPEFTKTYAVFTSKSNTVIGCV